MSLTTLLATGLGTLAAYDLHKARVGGSHCIQVALALPMMIPVILMAVGIFIFFAPLGLNNTVTDLVLTLSNSACSTQRWAPSPL